MGAMRSTYALNALREKRARLAGEIEALERKAAIQRHTLCQVDAAILLFDPNADPSAIRSIRPRHKCLLFRHGEQMRLCLSALREAKGPITARRVAEYAMLAKGMDVQDDDLRASIVVQVRVALFRLAARGQARRVVLVPDVWWELEGDDAAWRQQELL
jgi:hypothetical protein